MGFEDETSEPESSREYMHASPDAVHVGELVESYCVESFLGAGSMANVWRVRHVRLQATRALKIMHDASEQWLARFLREGAIQARLNHAHILRVHDVIYVHGRPALLMDLANEGSLAQRLEQGPLSTELCRRWSTHILQGLEAAHAANVVHRDIKPSNILFRTVGNETLAVIADFGIARQPGDLRLTQSQGLLGTPAYMSPEQTRTPQNVGPAADMFSFGVTLYEMLTARRPFGGEDVLEILNATASGVYPLLEGVPEDLAGLVEACLRSSPDARPDATRALSMLGVSTHPMVATSMDRSLAWGYVLFALTGVLFLGFVGIVWTSRDEPIPPQPEETPEEVAFVDAALVRSVHKPGEALALLQAKGQAHKDVRRALIHRGANTRVIHASQQVFKILLTPDERIVVGLMINGDVQAWERETGNIVFTHKAFSFERPRGAKISSDGRFLAVIPDTTRISTPARTRVRLLDMKTGRLLYTFSNGNTFSHIYFEFHPTKPQAVTASENGHLTVWDLETGAPDHRIKLASRIRGSCLSYAPDGERVAYFGHDGYVHTIETKTGDVNRHWNYGSLRTCHLTWSPQDPDAFLVSHEKGMVRWNVEDGQVLSQSSGVSSLRRPILGHDVVALEGRKYQLHLFDYPSLKPSFTLHHVGMIKGIVFDAFSQQVAVGLVDGTVKIWSTQDGTIAQTLQGHESWVLDLVSVNMDGLWEIWSAGRDRTVRAWSILQPKAATLPRGSRSVRWSKDGRVLMSLTPEQRAVFSRPREKHPETISLTPEKETSRFRGMHLSRWGKYALELHDSGSYIHQIWPERKRLFVPGVASYVRFGPYEEAQIVVINHQHSYFLIKFSFEGPKPTYSIQKIPYGKNAKSYMGATSDGKWLFSFDFESSVEVRSLTDGVADPRRAPTLCEHPSVTESLVPDSSQVVIGDWTGIIEIWDMAKAHRRHILRGHTDAITSIDVLEDGRFLSSSRDGTIRLWRGQESTVFRGHSGEVLSLGLSPDQKQFVSVGRDNTLILWDLETALPLHQISTQRALYGVWWEDEQIQALDTNGVLWQWNLQEITNAHEFSNLRVCPGTTHVVPVVPFDTSSPVWAPDALCPPNETDVAP